jgi:predicted nucleotidyltransferase
MADTAPGLGLPARVREALTELVAGLKESYGPRLGPVILYGSFARGKGRLPDSDVDVLVVLNGEVDSGQEIDRQLSLATAISLKHDLVVSTLFRSRAWFQGGDSPLWLNVQREGIRL